MGLRIWSLGPHLIVGGVNTGLILPQIVVRFLPVVANARFPGRAMVMFYLVLAILIAAALASMTGARARRIAVVSALIILLDFISAPFPMFYPEAPSIYSTLRGLPEGGVLELPIGINDGFSGLGAVNMKASLYQSLHEHPITGGHISRLPPSLKRAHLETPVLAALLRLSADGADDAPLPDRAAILAFCRGAGIRYVVVDDELAPERLRAFVRSGCPSA